MTKDGSSPKRDLVSIADLSKEEFEFLLALAGRLKDDLAAGRPHAWLPGTTLAMIFEKPSLRTRVTFEAGMNQLGGLAVYLAPGDIQLGSRESVPDIAENLSCWVDAIMARTYSHSSVVQLAKHAGVPVINGLSDLSHPCQVLADCFTLSETAGDIASLSVTFVGDGNNVVHSWLLAAATMGFDFTLACPPGYEPNEAILADAREKAAGKIEITNDVAAACDGVDVLYTDVWASMGQEEEAEQRRLDFDGYQLNQACVDRAAAGVAVMHCLPAHRGEEISAEVLEGPNSVVLRQAENRLHAQKALLAWLLGAKEAKP